MVRSHNSKFFFASILLVLLLVTLSACKPQPAAPATPTVPPPPTEPPPTEAPPLTEVPPIDMPPPTEVPPTEAPPTEEPPTEAPMQEPTEEPLPPEPQEIAFTAADGQEHLGTYYPAAVNHADVVVLHHWARGDKDDWIEIAFWLQNRGLVGNTPPGEPWLDPSWFPPMPERISFAIFTFSFRGCDGGCSGFDPTAGCWMHRQL